MAPLVPTTLIAPVAEYFSLAPHAPAVPLKVVPVPTLNERRIPVPFPVPQVPAVSPGIVIDMFVAVPAAVIENVNGYDLFVDAFIKDPPKVPVRLLFTTKDSVTVFAFAVPHPKSTTL